MFGLNGVYEHCVCMCGWTDACVCMCVCGWMDARVYVYMYIHAHKRPYLRDIFAGGMKHHSSKAIPSLDVLMMVVESAA